MNPFIPHPDVITFSEETVNQRFRPYRFQPGEQVSWYFQVMVENSTRVAPETGVAPQPNGPLISLALLNRPDPPCDLEIYGQQLPADIDPADWLDLWMAETKITPLSSKRVRTLAGAVGDVVGAWEADGQKFVGRLFCLKAGPRLILMWFRCAEADYPKLADDIFITLTTFGFPDDSPGPLAERIQWVEHKSPVRCRVAIPASWEMKIDQTVPNVSSFQASLTASGPAGPLMLARLSFGVISPELIGDHDQAIGQAITAVSSAGVTIAGGRTIPEAPTAPYTESSLTVRAAKLGDQSAEFRCRVLRHPQCWIVVVVVTVDRATSSIAWMRAKRMLDIATSTIEFPESA